MTKEEALDYWELEWLDLSDLSNPIIDYYAAGYYEGLKKFQFDITNGWVGQDAVLFEKGYRDARGDYWDD
jgi:hypothetical protein